VEYCAVTDAATASDRSIDLDAPSDPPRMPPQGRRATSMGQVINVLVSLDGTRPLAVVSSAARCLP
jgi:hypothetical protein